MKAIKHISALIVLLLSILTGAAKAQNNEIVIINAAPHACPSNSLSFHVGAGCGEDATVWYCGVEKGLHFTIKVNDSGTIIQGFDLDGDEEIDEITIERSSRKSVKYLKVFLGNASQEKLLAAQAEFGKSQKPVSIASWQTGTVKTSLNARGIPQNVFVKRENEKISSLVKLAQALLIEIKYRGTISPVYDKELFGLPNNLYPPPWWNIKNKK